MCSSIGQIFIEDSTAPSPVQQATLTPAGPSNQNVISLSGMTDADSQVQIFANDQCLGLAVAVVASNSAGVFTANLTVLDNTTTAFRTVVSDSAGNSTECSMASITYIEDSAAPAAPVFTGSTPRLRQTIIVHDFRNWRSRFNPFRIY